MWIGGGEEWAYPGILSVMGFYEKVIKVKADVAAYLIAFHLQNPTSLTIELGTKRNAGQLGFVP